MKKILFILLMCKMICGFSQKAHYKSFGNEDEIIIKATGEPLNYTVIIIDVVKDTLQYKSFGKIKKLPLTEVSAFRCDREWVKVPSDGKLTEEQIQNLTMVKYAIVSKSTFENKTDTSFKSADFHASFMDGMYDGEKYYNGRNCGAGWTLLTTVGVGAILGLVPAIACSATRPSLMNLEVPKRNLLHNEAYMKGYISSAHLVKKKKVWKAFGIGCAINVAVFLIVAYH